MLLCCTIYYSILFYSVLFYFSTKWNNRIDENRVEKYMRAEQCRTGQDIIKWNKT